DVPTTPIIEWFRAGGGPIREFNQSYVVPVPATLTLTDLTAAFTAVTNHHDALRMRLHRTPDTHTHTHTHTDTDTDTGTGTDRWTLHIPPPGTIDTTNWIHHVDTTGLDPHTTHQTLIHEAQKARTRLDPEQGITAQLVWLDAGNDHDGQLLIVIHHLVIDGVSWRILLDDLATAHHALTTHQPLHLEPVATSFRGWATALTQTATHNRWTSQLPYWENMLAAPHTPLGATPLDPTRDTLATAQTVTLALPEHETEQLLTAVPAAFRAGINDVLLTALTLALRQWAPTHTHNGILIDLESHGRHEDTLDSGHDLTRTIGWFTTMHPVRINPGTLTWTEVTTAGPQIGTALKHVKEQLRAIPDHGLGYGLLRHLNPHTAPTLATHPHPLIGFNYLGRFTTDTRDGTAQHWTSVTHTDTGNSIGE
ncbi:condensation domain-containing protein, partial [Streptomyces sp. NPDC057438]|uniref:condensation domain-containing protein n=1 Tax=Streptomyces sp. NPDC057438 TaxID=3346133 RepID=UPI0036C3F277